MPKLRDMHNFDPTTFELKKLGNFAMEFTKWIPTFESMYYEGTMHPEEEGDPNHTFWHGIDDPSTEKNERVSTAVTPEYWAEFNKHKVSDSEMEDVFGMESGDWEGFDPHDNWESIQQYEAVLQSLGKYGDGLSTYRRNFVAGMRHRVSEFGPGSEASDVWAGKDFGKAYDNLDFSAAAWEWEHILVPKTDSINHSAAGNQAYFINNELAAFGYSWGGLNSWAQATFGNKNFYDIIMSKQAQDLSAENSLKLVLLMKESRNRIWHMEEQVFGPLAHTRDDSAMKHFVENFCRRNVPNLNFHSISLFLQIFKVQHGLTNFMTAYWMGEKEKGHYMARLDNYRFWNFTQGLGAQGFRAWLEENQDYDFNNDTISANNGKLYDFRAAFSGLTEQEYKDGDGDAAAESKYEAVNDLIEDWFGSYYPEYGRPVSADVSDFAIKDGKKYQLFSGYAYGPRWDAPGTWVPVPSGFNMDFNSDGENFSDCQYVFLPDYQHASLGYDRKFNENAFWFAAEPPENPSHDNVKILYRNHDTSKWVDFMNHFYSSYINDTQTGNYIHVNYTGYQVAGLTTSWMTSGREYNKNWAVHLIGELWKNGMGKAFEKVIWRGMERRKSTKEYKREVEEYQEKKDEIAYNKQIEQKEVARAHARRKQMLKAIDQRQNAHRAENKRAEQQQIKKAADERRAQNRSENNQSNQRAAMKAQAKNKKKK